MRVERLGNLVRNLDNRRKPLNSVERQAKGQRGLYPYIGANNIVGYIDEYLFDEKILCLAEDGGSWGSEETCAVIYEGKTWVNNHAHVLIENGEANLEYIKYYLNQANLNKYITGTTRGKLTKSALESIEIPLPKNFEDQIRIATVLSKAEALIAQRKESIRLLDDLLKSTFLEMFGDPIRNNLHWKTINLGSSVKVKHGYAFKSEYFSDSGEFVLLTPGNFNEEGGFRDRGKRQKFYTGEIPKEYILSKNDLLLAMTEQAPGLLGSPLLVPDSGCFLHNQRLGLVTYDPKDFNEKFLFHLFNTKGIRNNIHTKATGTKVRHTSPTKIEELVVYKPHIEIQKQFAQIAEKTDQLNFQFKSSLKELEILFSSLSQLAFKNELDLSQMKVVVPEYITSQNNKTEQLLQKDPKNTKTVSTKEIEAVAMQSVANKIIEKYRGFHFSFEMLRSFIEHEKINYDEYFSSEEMKKNPKLNVNPDNVEDLKNFVSSAIENHVSDLQLPKNPWIKLNQVFYDASKTDLQLNLRLEDIEKTKTRSIEEQSGIYFEIIS